MDGSSSAVFCSECNCSQADSWERLEKDGSDAVDNLCGSCYAGRSKGIESLDNNSCAVPFLDPAIVESIDEKDEGESSTHPEPPTTPSSDNRNIKANLRRSTSVSNNNDSNNTPKLMLRNKNVKMKNTKNKVLKILPTKGKSRRHTLKRNPTKAPNTTASVTTSEFIFHKNVYWQVGDVVSILDEEDGDIYYAQLQGFFQSENFSKSAMVSWLLPGLESPEHGFDPKTYTLGPEEPQPISMDCFEFICHNPSLKPSTTFQHLSNRDSGYILSSAGQ